MSKVFRKIAHSSEKQLEKFKPKFISKGCMGVTCIFVTYSQIRSDHTLKYGVVHFQLYQNQRYGQQRTPTGQGATYYVPVQSGDQLYGLLKQQSPPLAIQSTIPSNQQPSSSNVAYFQQPNPQDTPLTEGLEATNSL